MENKNDIEKQLKEGLQSFVGKKNTTKIKDEIEMMTKRILLKNDALMNGAEPDSIKINILWDTFTLKQKALWFFYNVLTKKGSKKRAEIDQINKKRLEEAKEEAKRNYLEDYEGWEWEDYYIREETPDIYKSDPKSILKADFKLRPVQSIEFIGLNLQLEDIQKNS